MRCARVTSASGEALYVKDEGGGTLLPLAGPPWEGVALAGRAPLDASNVRWLAPVMPGKIVCIGRNYREHAKELGHEVPPAPHVFLKPPSTLLAPGAPIVRPVHMSSLVHHEGELGVVIAHALRNADPTAAMAAVFGYTCGNDVTARDVQREEKHFTRAKGFDTFCPVGPAVVTADEIRDPQTLQILVTVDGELRQDGFTRDMVFPVAHLLAYISRIMTLYPGDLVLTGTPAGVGPLVAGNLVSVEIPGIGALSNPVVDGPALAPL